MFTVNVPVVDLRREPSFPDFSSKEIDRKQESQLLFGERVLIDEQGSDGWVKVRAIEQERFRKETAWTGYPGWIKRSCLVEGNYKHHLVITTLWLDCNGLNLALGTYLEKEGEEDNHWIVRLPDGNQVKLPKGAVSLIASEKEPKRQRILATAQKMLGQPYRWGGRVPHLNHWQQTFTSVDCSGLTNLVHRVYGIKIPRDAQDQFLKCEVCEPLRMMPADFIFLAKEENPDHMVHVMLYMDGDQFIDSNINDGVIISTFSQRFGICY